MGQFDKFIKAPVGQHGEEVTVRAPKKAVAVNTKTGEEIDIAAEVGKTNQGGEPATSLPIKPLPVTSTRMERKRAKGLARTTLRMGAEGEVYDTDPDAKPKVTGPTAGYESIKPSTGPFVTSQQFESNKAAKKFLQRQKEDKGLASTTMRMSGTGEVYDTETHYEGIGGITKLDENLKQSRPSTIVPTEPTKSDSFGAMHVASDLENEGPVKGGVKETDREKEVRESDELLQKQGQEEVKREAAQKTVRTSGTNRIPGSDIEGKPLKAPYVKPQVERKGNVVPLEAINTSGGMDANLDVKAETERQKKIRANRSPNVRTTVLDIGNLPSRALAGSAEGEITSRARYAERQEKLGGKEVESDAEDQKISALAKRIGKSKGMSDEAVNHPLFRKGEEYTKASVMTRAGLGDDPEKLDAHLGGNPGRAANTLRQLYSTFENRANFKKPHYEYSAERGNLNPETDHFRARTGELVKLSDMSHPENPLRNTSSLKGSRVGFQGFAIDNMGRATQLKHESGSDLHEGWHPYESTNSAGVKVRVFEHHTIPKNAIHNADIAEQAIKTGKSHAQVLRDMAGGKEVSIMVGGRSAVQAPKAPIAGAVGAKPNTSNVLEGRTLPSGRARGQKKATKISQDLVNAATVAPLGKNPLVSGGTRVNVRQIGQPATAEGTRELTEAEKGGVKATSTGRDDSRKLVESSPGTAAKEGSSVLSRLQRGPQWREATESDLKEALGGGHITKEEYMVHKYGDETFK